nr:PREDICTED: uncharacterized protein LOC102687488 [Lepisosteus oculatus]
MPYSCAFSTMKSLVLGFYLAGMLFPGVFSGPIETTRGLLAPQTTAPPPPGSGDSSTQDTSRLDQLDAPGSSSLPGALLSRSKSGRSGKGSVRDVSVSCRESEMVVRVRKDFYGFGYRDARLTLGPDCQPSSLDEDTGDLLFKYNLLDCGSRRLMPPGYVVYKNFLHYIPNQRAAAARGLPRINVEIECYYSRKNDDVSFESSKDDTVFDLKLMNDAWTAVSKTNIYNSGDQLHVQASCYPAFDGEKLFINHCFTTLSGHPKPTPQYILVDNLGCANNRMGAKFVSPRADDAINLAFDTTPLKDMEIYLHCSMFLSTPETTEGSKSCNYCAATKRWKDIGQVADGVCDCCNSNCTAKMKTNLPRDLKSLGPIVIKGASRSRGAGLFPGAEILWFQAKGGDHGQGHKQDFQLDEEDSSGDAEEDEGSESDFGEEDSSSGGDAEEDEGSEGDFGEEDSSGDAEEDEGSESDGDDEKEDSEGDEEDETGDEEEEEEEEEEDDEWALTTEQPESDPDTPAADQHTTPAGVGTRMPSPPAAVVVSSSPPVQTTMKANVTLSPGPLLQEADNGTSPSPTSQERPELLSEEDYEDSEEFGLEEDYESGDDLAEPQSDQAVLAPGTLAREDGVPLSLTPSGVEGAQKGDDEHKAMMSQ